MVLGRASIDSVLLWVRCGYESLGAGFADHPCQAGAPADDRSVVSSEGTLGASQAQSIQLGHDADYKEFVDAQFMALALGEGLLRMRGLGWPSDFRDIDSLGEILCAASYDFSKARCVLARLPTAVGMLVIQGKRFVARLAAESEDALDEAERFLRETVPQATPDPERQESFIGFWRADSMEGGAVTYARLPVPSWSEIADNYASSTSLQLDGMMASFRPGHGGRLLLWTGSPGTGKTYALRALAWEWRTWCAVHYITDPETLFGGNSSYLMHLLTRPGPSKEWRLLVLEDTGELLSADAKSRTGQGLSRLLNVVDGLIGQGFPTLVLVTTNELIRTLHPAIARPGRCASHIEFEPFSKDEAGAWLAGRQVDNDEGRSRTLAELYAIADGFAVPQRSQQTVGFSG
jgi:hypothetical protein